MSITKNNLIVIILILGLTALFCSSCSDHVNSIKNFQNDEVKRIDKSINEILTHIGYSNYHIFIQPHGMLHSGLKDSHYKFEYFTGKGFVPEGPPGVDPNYPPGYNERKDKYGLYMNRNTSYEYYENNDKLKYCFDHINVLIIFNKITKENKNKISTLLANNVLNKKREDSIMIIEKATLE